MGVHIAHWKVSGRTLAPLELNEVMYTLELGIVTAGFLFMSAVVLATAVFGRFFCSWGCHVLALQDLCAWLLGKLRIRARPIRSRMLLAVPPIAMFYMFAWPQVARALAAKWPGSAAIVGVRPAFDLRIAGDAEGWASFVTTDFWRNLPGPVIAILTLLICGFAIVYFLGSRSFCQYACPYGVVFGLADRIAPGQIVLRGDCTQCGLCTAGCQSGIRVHEEVARFGKVVSSRCLKDLDCVSVCPTQGLSFGFARPSFLKSLLSKKRTRVRYDFSPLEEGLIAVTFVATLLIFRGLYSAVPFLMALGLAGILAFLAVWTRRLLTDPALRLGGAPLKTSGHWTRRGKAFLGGVALLTVFTVHSGFIRYHEVRGEGVLRRLAQPEAGREDLERALLHLGALDRWGLVATPALKPRLAELNLSLERFGEAEGHLRQVLMNHPDLHDARFQLARALLGQQRAGEARAELERVAHSGAHAQRRADAHELLASLRAAAGDREGAISELRAVLAEDGDRVARRLDLADLLVSVGELGEAEGSLRTSLGSQPGSIRAHHNLAVILARTDRVEEAIGHLEEAVRLAPGDPQIRRTLDLLRVERGEPGHVRDDPTGR